MPFRTMYLQTVLPSHLLQADHLIRSLFNSKLIDIAITNDIVLFVQAVALDSILIVRRDYKVKWNEEVVTIQKYDLYSTGLNISTHCIKTVGLLYTSLRCPTFFLLRAESFLSELRDTRLLVDVCLHTEKRLCSYETMWCKNRVKIAAICI
mmetsp:Transcript_28590/g.35068  ORF Transcript_28590/g.35068 Transcript_28590/m.35068 type:complete len:151 (-) Transcript_28590:281-733(-)